MRTATYEGTQGFGKTGKALESFGEKQNVLNAKLLERLEETEAQLKAALERIAALEAEQERNIQRFGRCAAELDAMQKELDRLRLTTKLNSNTVERLVKQSENTEG